MGFVGKAFVPEISDSRLNELIQVIVPVIRKDGELYSIELPDLRNTAYTWGPVLKEKVENLKEVARIKTDHYCGYYAFFKPSIAEVLAQIPEDMIAKVCAFEIVSDDVKVYRYGNGQQATTILYGL